MLKNISRLIKFFVNFAENLQKKKKLLTILNLYDIIITLQMKEIKMYIWSFCKSILKPKNILPAIYFLINAAIVFFIFAILPFQIVEDSTMNFVYLGLIGLAVNLVFILISLTPFGEALWRFRNNVKKAPEAALESQWIMANQAFEEVKEKANSISRSVSKKVKLYYDDSDDLNAFALGHRTVIVTRGMLMQADSEVLKGVLAHELGHIAHGDSDLKLGINVSNSILIIFLTIINFINNIIIGLFFSTRSSIAHILGMILKFVFGMLLIWLFKLWNWIGTLCINWSSRKAEFAADSYAKELGYGEQLQYFLHCINDNVKTSKFNLMFQTHPDTNDRLSNLA